MLKLLSIVLLLTMSTPIFAQELKNEGKIKDFLGNERFVNSVQNNPGFIKFLDVKIENGYAIEPFNVDKSEDFVEISTITYNRNEKGEQISVDQFLLHSELEDFNILFYDFPMPENGENGYFLMKDTDKVISVYSSKYLNKQL